MKSFSFIKSHVLLASMNLLLGFAHTWGQTPTVANVQMFNNTGQITLSGTNPSPDILTYERLELRIRLSDDSYCPNDIAKNPFNPANISITCNFVGPSGQSYEVFGYFADDTNCGTDPNRNRWRVRFAPPRDGLYSYSITVSTPTSPATTFDGPTFDVTRSDNPGYLNINQSSNQSLTFDDGSSFFGIAEDLRTYNGNHGGPPHCDCAPPNTNCATHNWGPICTLPSDWYDPNNTGNNPNPCVENFCYSQYTLCTMQGWLRDFAANGGNLVRLWFEPYGFEIEWGGAPMSYRLNRATDFDALLNTDCGRAWNIHPLSAL